MKEHFQKTVLENGIRVLTERIPQFRSASIGIWVDVGSVNEDDSNRGASHFLEHLLFKGTPTRTAREIAEIMDGVGGNLNAFTEKEQTCFYAKVMDKHIPLAIEMLGDMITNSTFPEEEVEREKKVVLEEIKMYEDSPDELIFDLVAQASWEDHPLGRPILGSAESLTRLSRETLVDFVKRFYTPNKIIVSVAGHAQHDQIVKLVEDNLPFLSDRVFTRPVISPPPFTPNRITRFKETEQTHFCMAMRGVPHRDDRRHALAVLDTVLGGSLSSRLFQEIREKRGLCYNIASFQGTYADAAIFGVYSAASPANVETVIRLAKEILHKIKDKGITAKEFKMAKEHLKGSLSLSIESATNRMIHMAKSEIYHGRLLGHEEILKKIQGVDLEEVHAVAQEVLDLDRCTWAVLGPVAEEALAK